MRRNLGLLPLFALALAALACSLAPAGTILFKDDFSDSSGEWKQTDYATINDGKLELAVNEAKTLIWTTIKETGLENVRVEVTAENAARAQDEVFGLVCNYQDADNFYFLGIGTDGYYLIEKYEKNEETLLLDGMSDRFADSAAAYRVGADCSQGNLTLYVEGEKVAEVADPAFTKGDVGLFVSSGKKPKAVARFDDFVVTALK